MRARPAVRRHAGSGAAPPAPEPNNHTRSPTHHPAPPPTHPHRHARSAYRNLDTIETRGADDVVNATSVKLLLGATKSLELSVGGASCSDTLALPAAGSCPTGTSQEANPAGADVWKAAQCEPCDAGVKCPAGVAAPCPKGEANPLWGAAACTACTGFTAAITDGRASCQECAAGTTIINNDFTQCQLW